MQSALEIACSHAKQYGSERIVRIKLKVGVLSGVVPEALEFAFAALSPGSLAEGATLEIQSFSIRLKCTECGNEFDSDALFFPCPQCCSESATLIHGEELEITQIEMEKKISR